MGSRLRGTSGRLANVIASPLPKHLRSEVPARQTIAVGETYDFEVDLPPVPQNLWIDVRSTAGKWLAQGHVIVK